MAQSTAGPDAAAITFVHPGPDAFDWLLATVRGLKEGDPLRPVTVVTPNYYAARYAGRYLARNGGSVNVRATRLGGLVPLLAAPDSTGEPVPMLTPLREASAIRWSLAQAGGDLATLTGHPSFQRALAALFRELRRRECDAQALLDEQPGVMAVAALRCFLRFRERTAGYADATSLREQAAEHLRQLKPGDLAEIGAIVLFLPTRLDPVDLRLLAAAAQLLPLRAAFPFFADAGGTGDETALAAARDLAAHLNIAVPAPSGAAPARLQVSVIRAPSPAEEVREVVRRIGADLEAGVPLYQMAVLYRQMQPYAGIVREALDLAGIPWSALEGRPVAESLPGRALLALLKLGQRRFARSAVIAFLDATGRATAASAWLEAPAWDRISREAGVTRGLDQWQSRLRAQAADLERRAEDSERFPLAPAGREALRHRAQQALRMAEAVHALGLALQPPADGSPWSAFVDWATGLWQRYGADGAWPEAEHAFIAPIEAAIESLRDAGHFEQPDRGPGLALFLSTLEGALTDRALPVGRLGQGVLVGPVQDVAGLQFDRVHMLGLAEGVFPPPPPLDPFFAAGRIDPLGSAERYRAEQRQRFLTALAAGAGGRVTLTTPEALAGRAAFPSRYLLDLVASQLQQPFSEPVGLGTAAFRKLTEAEHDWLRVVRSSENGTVHAPVPADLEDLRLRQAAAWVKAGRPLRLHQPVRSGALPIERALTLMDARRGAGFTCFDGNVSALAPAGGRLLRHIAEEGTISPSAVERWATCPFRYFLGDILGVAPTPRPEDTWTIDPMERGSLVHNILQRLFVALRSAEDGCGRAASAAERRTLLRQTAATCFATAAESGISGHPLVWENTKAALLTDLETFLRLDAGRCSEDGLRPALFEQPFRAGADGWPAVTIEAGGATLRFRGSIDRVDIAGSGGNMGSDGSAPDHVRVLDYKTGKSDSYLGLKDDPVLAGKHVQLAIYTLAARAGLGCDASQVRAEYWFVTGRGGFAEQSLAGDDERVGTRLGQTLDIVVRGIRQGVFPQVPGGEDLRSFQNCHFCDFDRVCPSARDDLWTRKSGSDGYRLHAGLSVTAPEPETEP